MVDQTLSEELAAHVSGLEERLAAARRNARQAMEVATRLSQERNKAVELWFDDVLDAEILEDAELRKTLCKDAFFQTWAHERIKRVSSLGGWVEGEHHVGLGGIDGRDEYVMQSLPNLQINLVHGKPVEELAEKVRQWISVWALGRDEVYVGVRSQEYSDNGVLRLWVDSSEDKAHVDFLSYGHTEVMSEGTVAETLTYLISREPLRSYRDADEGDIW